MATVCGLSLLELRIQLKFELAVVTVVLMNLAFATSDNTAGIPSPTRIDIPRATDWALHFWLLIILTTVMSCHWHKVCQSSNSARSFHIFGTYNCPL
jgi:hypothetical protein